MRSLPSTHDACLIISKLTFIAFIYYFKVVHEFGDQRSQTWEDVTEACKLLMVAALSSVLPHLDLDLASAMKEKRNIHV